MRTEQASAPRDLATKLWSVNETLETLHDVAELRQDAELATMLGRAARAVQAVAKELESADVERPEPRWVRGLAAVWRALRG